MKITPKIVFWACAFGVVACRIAYAWRIMPGYQLFDSPLLSMLMLLFCGGAFWARYQIPSHAPWLTKKASKQTGIVLGVLIVLGIFYGARVVFNEYYGALAQASYGEESTEKGVR